MAEEKKKRTIGGKKVKSIKAPANPNLPMYQMEHEPFPDPPPFRRVNPPQITGQRFRPTQIPTRSFEEIIRNEEATAAALRGELPSSRTLSSRRRRGVVAQAAKSHITRGRIAGDPNPIVSLMVSQEHMSRAAKRDRNLSPFERGYGMRKRYKKSLLNLAEQPSSIRWRREGRPHSSHPIHMRSDEQFSKILGSGVGRSVVAREVQKAKRYKGWVSRLRRRGGMLGLGLTAASLGSSIKEAGKK